MMTKECPVCAVTFETKCSKYCSRRCSGVGRSRQATDVRRKLCASVTRQCRTCGFVGSVTMFAKTSKKRAGYERRCKVCQGKAVREWRLRNPDKVRLYNKKAQQKVGGERFWRYGVTDIQIAEMLASQGGCCAICRRPKGVMRMGVDHDHVTGAVRGILCTNCNTALGKFQDSPKVLLAAAKYLVKHGVR